MVGEGDGREEREQGEEEGRGQVRRGSVVTTGNPQRTHSQLFHSACAQEYKPHGVHVCMVIIDGFVDAPGMRTQRMTAKAWENEQGEPGAYFLNPNDIGEACVYLCTQPQSVWTHELWLTPKNVVLGQRL